MSTFLGKYFVLLFLINACGFFYSLQGFNERFELSGRIIDKETSKPLVGVNVFLSGTTIGTTTDTNGHFILEKLPRGSFDLVLSMIGYEVNTIKIFLDKNYNYNLGTIQLQERVYQLGEIQIVDKKDEDWQKNYKLFEENFLGQSENSKLCEIINKELINFQKTNDGKLIANANDWLKINNYALGYRIKFLLRKFVLSPDLVVNYRGEYFYEEIDSTNELKQIWRENRRRSYYGSLRHFLVSFAENSLRENNFFVYYSIKPNWLEVVELLDTKFGRKSIDINNLIDPGLVLQKIRLKENYLLVEYRAESESPEYFKFRQARGSFIGDKLRFQVSWIELLSNKLIFTREGLILNSEDPIRLFGYWAFERIADMLPLNYVIN